MSTRRLIQSTLVLLLIALSYFIGYFAYQYLHNPIRMHQGVWYGKGQITFGDIEVESFATLIVENRSARLSVDNRYKQFNYTYDVDLEYKQSNHERNHLEITKRTVNGLEEFIEATGIQVPSYGTLLSIDGWRIDDEELFLNIQLSKDSNASFLLIREDDL